MIVTNNKIELQNEELQDVSGGKGAKKVIDIVKYSIPAGNAASDPSLGPVLRNYGINVTDFINEFNAKTKEYEGVKVHTTITIFVDHSFVFLVKSPPASVLIKRAKTISK